MKGFSEILSGRTGQKSNHKNDKLFKLICPGIINRMHLAFVICFLSFPLFSQTDLKIGTTPGSKKASAVFELESTTKGFLMPRLTTTQMNAIGAPVTGLMIFNTTDSCTYMYRGATSGWKSNCTALPPSAWTILGNSGTSASTNFLGTTDNISLNFRVNNQKAGSIDNTNNNVFFGYQAGNVNTGTQNTFIGHQSGSANTTGLSNIAIGYKAAYSNTTGRQNVAVGDSAFYSNTAGYQNTVMGNQAGYNNTTGYINQFIGDGAGYGNTTGWHNTVIGFQAGYNLTSGAGNILLGRYAGFSDNVNKLTGNKNVAIGDQAGQFITSGYQNVFVGDNAGVNNMSGYLNVAIGQGALSASTSVSTNVAIGASALAASTTGNSNVAVGPYALYSTITGYSNVAVGSSAGRNATGYDNTFLGNSAGNWTSTGINNTFAGASSGANSYTGSQNTFLGHGAGFGSGTASGSDNVYVGYNAGYNFTASSGNAGVGRDALLNSTGNNNTALGYQAGNGLTTGSNNIVIGSAAQVPTATAGNQLSIGNWIYGVGGSIGIGTSAPSNQLHVFAASNPIRVEGLQSSAATDSMLTVNSTGVVRRTNAPAYVNIVDLTGTSAITAGTLSATGGGSTLGFNSVVAYTTTFTLTRSSLILVDASTNCRNFVTTGGAAINDGSMRFFRSYWNFAASTVRYGVNTQLYTNSVNTDTQVLEGSFSNNNGFNTILTPGTYTLNLNIVVACSSSRNAKFDYGNDVSDRISIKAVQLQ